MNKEGQTNVFVKFLPPTVDDTELCTLFSKFGTIVSCKVMINQVTGVSLGYGFVRFSCEEEAKKAIEGMVGCKLGTKTLLCKLSDPFCFPDPSCNLYIKPLPLGLSDDELRIVFAKYGQIATVKLVADVGIPDSLVGFVKYESMDSATRAIEELNGAKIFALLPPLIVKYAESDVQRAVRKANSHPPSRKQPFLSAPMSPSLQESLSLKNKLNNSDFEVPSQSPPNSPRKPIYDFDLPLLNSSCSSNYYSADNYVSYMPCYYVPVQVYYYDRAVPDYCQPSYSYSSSYSSYPQHLQQ